jgi:hypothetical protein
MPQPFRAEVMGQGVSTGFHGDCYPDVTPDVEKRSGRPDLNRRPPAPKAEEGGPPGAAGDRFPSFFLVIFQLGATAGNFEPLPIVSHLSAGYRRIFQ